jgi:hypothetical protein
MMTACEAPASVSGTGVQNAAWDVTRKLRAPCHTFLNAASPNDLAIWIRPASRPLTTVPPAFSMRCRSNRAECSLVSTMALGLGSGGGAPLPGSCERPQGRQDGSSRSCGQGARVSREL